MAIPLTQVEELLSISCVNAIVSKAGALFSPNAIDFGVDASIRKVGEFNGERIDLGCVFDLQLKASINWKREEKHIVYDMRAEAYNKLIKRNENSTIPCLLVLMCLPRDNAAWLLTTEERTVLQESCYFFHIQGDATNNGRSFRIRIPRENLLTPDAVGLLIAQVEQGRL